MPAPVLTIRAFRKALDDRSFAPVYLLHGEDEFRKEQAVKQLVAAAVDEGLRDFNVEVRRGSELDAGTLGSLLNTPPMMADRRVVVVRDVTALRKDARAELDRYLLRPSADTVAVLVAVAGAKVDKGLLDQAPSVPFEPLTGEHVTKWIAHYVDSELQGSIAPEAAELLHAAVGTDLPQLASELDKLLSYTGGAIIDERAVTAIVGVRRGETLGDLLDAVAVRDVRTALALIPHVLQQPKTNGVTVVMALATQMLAIAWGQAARAEGQVSQAQLESQYFTLLKESGAFPMRPWGEAVKCWARAVPRWSAPALDRALDALLQADMALKESGVSNDEQRLTSLVLSICAAEPRPAVA
ncbi:MAG TPA: DNA polymerase III subunit delta [Gemmatimonadaceae bacterium]|jgi:DNA polymerase-3 subunit delta|nr:DNA polymerase III subunit delta [Gemmatimonadaceae bacterium]